MWFLDRIISSREQDSEDKNRFYILEILTVGH